MTTNIPIGRLDVQSTDPYNNRKIIAWGLSPILELFIVKHPNHPFAYGVDSDPEKRRISPSGLPMYSPEKLFQENRSEVFVVNSALTSPSFQAIHRVLSENGYRWGIDFTDLSDFLRRPFRKKAELVFQRKFSLAYYTYARTFNLNSSLPLETTILGNWLLLEAIAGTKALGGAIAEVGAYRCGNAFLLLSAMALNRDERKYFIFDSFCGFPQMTQYDPLHLQKAFNVDYQANQAINAISHFDQSRVIPGFIPRSFGSIPEDQEFSVVFYDCDLYQPALDTYNYFWPRIKPGGVLVIHDNIATPSGWKGVRKATEEFFNPLAIRFHDFWETTMAVVFKK